MGHLNYIEIYMWGLFDFASRGTIICIGCDVTCCGEFRERHVAIKEKYGKFRLLNL